MGGSLDRMGKTRTVRLSEHVTATVERAAAAEGVNVEQWVNHRLARDLFLEKLDEIQSQNTEPLTEHEAVQVVYGH